MPIANVLSQSLGATDILILPPLVAPAQKDHKRFASLNKIDTIPRSVINSNFTDAITDRLDVTRVSQTQAANANDDARDRSRVWRTSIVCGVYYTVGRQAMPHQMRFRSALVGPGIGTHVIRLNRI
jgi:hypothetical protein